MNNFRSIFFFSVHIYSLIDKQFFQCTYRNRSQNCSRIHGMFFSGYFHPIYRTICCIEKLSSYETNPFCLSWPMQVKDMICSQRQITMLSLVKEQLNTNHSLKNRSHLDFFSLFSPFCSFTRIVEGDAINDVLEDEWNIVFRESFWRMFMKTNQIPKYWIHGYWNKQHLSNARGI